MIVAYLYAEIMFSIPSTFSSWYAHTSGKEEVELLNIATRRLFVTTDDTTYTSLKCSFSFEVSAKVKCFFLHLTD